DDALVHEAGHYVNDARECGPVIVEAHNRPRREVPLPRGEVEAHVALEVVAVDEQQPYLRAFPRAANVSGEVTDHRDPVTVTGVAHLPLSEPPVLRVGVVNAVTHGPVAGRRAVAGQVVRVDSPDMRTAAVSGPLSQVDRTLGVERAELDDRLLSGHIQRQ